ncbi:hypothetical protein [Conexibacter arvalis]|uniref:Uncharacterized protein n=1 Tax=Conexibacter arvalis TaxID=912552 RepID=A0A840IJM0_9ACTN|nr:hypothetical protein [Conexibacter arvalis]MBB4665287.1 hypothetical protein [Conexibacter arvalis]
MAATAHPPKANDALAQRCASIAERSRVPVLCPDGIPAARGDRRPVPGRFRVRPKDLVAGDCAYLIELHARRADRSGREPYHVLAGGRCFPSELTTRDGRWPRRGVDDDAVLRLLGRATLRPGDDGPIEPVRPRVVDRVRVGDRPGLLLRVAPFPRGGIHGGHLAGVWNRDGAGYVLSFHNHGLGARPAPDERRARDLLAAASKLSNAARTGEVVAEPSRDDVR